MSRFSGIGKVRVGRVEVSAPVATDSLTILTTTGRDRDKVLAKVFERTGQPPRAYDRATWFAVEEVPVGSIHDLYEALTSLEGMERSCIIRGAPIAGFDRSMVRKTSSVGRDADGSEHPAYFEEKPRHWLMLDVDHADTDLDMADLVGSARRTVEEMLPECFHAATFVAQCSSSAGTGLKRGQQWHLWFWLDRPTGREVLKELAKKAAQRLGKVDSKGKLQDAVDKALFTAVQPHYTAAPIFQEGCFNPFEGRARTFLVAGKDDAVTLPRIDVDREHEAASVLAQHWPQSERHLAQLALAGALLRDGWDDDHAHAFLCEVCREVGDEDPDKRAITVRDTRSKLSADAPVAGWRRLGELLGNHVVVSTVRGLLAKADDWHGLLQKSEKGALVSSDSNVAVILEHDPDWTDVLAWNVREQSPWLMSEPPVPLDWEGRPRPLTDADGLAVCRWFAVKHKVSLPFDRLVRLLYLVAQRSKFDPFRDHLNGLVWDGVPRLDSWLHRYVGAEDTAYSRFVGRKWLISAVARTYLPGCQADYTLVLEGIQRAGKSSLFRALTFDHPEWFCDSLPADLGCADAERQLWGPVLVEISELASFRKSGIEVVKGFLTRRYSDMTQKYEKTKSQRPRTVVFAGTTNDSAYLVDPTGNARFWPIYCTKIDSDGLRTVVPQLWAEAVSRFKHWLSEGGYGTKERLWWPTDEEMAGAAVEQDARNCGHPWEEIIADALELGAPRGPAFGVSKEVPKIPPKADKVTSRQIAVHALALEGATATDYRTIATLMQRLGWKSCRWWEGKTLVRGYARQ